jgi:hypothetical protein
MVPLRDSSGPEVPLVFTDPRGPAAVVVFGDGGPPTEDGGRLRIISPNSIRPGGPMVGPSLRRTPPPPSGGGPQGTGLQYSSRHRPHRSPYGKSSRRWQNRLCNSL